MHATIERWCEEYGPIFRFNIGRRHFVAVGDLDDINWILRERPHTFSRWQDEQRIFEEAGFSGVFSEEGEEWRRTRRLVVRTLSLNQLQRYYDVVRMASEQLYAHLLQRAATGSFDVTEVLMPYTVDITSALAFGCDGSSLSLDARRLQRQMDLAFATISRRLSAPFPYWRFFPLPADRAFARALAELQLAVAQFIEQARERMVKRPELFERPENFLEAMLAAQASDGSFTDAEIAGNTLGLLIAGEDTTANTLAWTVWLLSTRPALQDRLAEEARGRLAGERFPTSFEGVNELRLAEAVLRESMRIKPVAPALFMEPLVDVELQGVAIPAGTRLWLLTRHAALRTAEVERALEFDPDRWLEPESTPAREASLVFGAGPRFCPGRNLALLEAKAALAVFCRSFRFKPAGDDEVMEKLSFTMVPDTVRVELSRC